MKITKKIICVILTLAMLMTSVVITTLSTSAADDPVVISHMVLRSANGGPANYGERGTGNEDGSRTYDQEPHLVYNMHTHFPEAGKYYVNFIAKIERAATGVKESERALYVDWYEGGADVLEGEYADGPAISTFTDGVYQAVSVEITVKENRPESKQLRLSGAINNNGVAKITYGKDIIITKGAPMTLATDNNTPASPNEIIDMVLTAEDIKNQVLCESGGNPARFEDCYDAANKIFSLKTTAAAGNNHFVWSYFKWTSYDQPRYGYVAIGENYLRVLVKVDDISDPDKEILTIEAADNGNDFAKTFTCADIDEAGEWQYLETKWDATGFGDDVSTQFRIRYEAEVDVDFKEFVISSTPMYDVDYELDELIDAIIAAFDKAESLLENAVEGKDAGNYEEGSIEKFETALETLYYDFIEAETAEELQAVLDSLNAAIAEFEASKITKGELIPGLNSVWYKPVDENGNVITESGDILKDLIGEGSGGQSKDDVKHFDSSFDKLFKQENLKVVARTVMETFEIQGKTFTSGFNLNEKAAELDVPTKDGGEVDALIIKYQGYITASESGTYKFTSKNIDNGCVIEIGDKKVFEYWAASSWLDDDNLDSYDGEEFTLEAGESVPITIYYFEQDGGQILQFDVYQDGELKPFSAAGFMLSVNNGVDEPDPIPDPDPKEPGSNDPKTGSIMPYAVVVFISASALTAVAAKKRKYAK